MTTHRGQAGKHWLGIQYMYEFVVTKLKVECYLEIHEINVKRVQNNKFIFFKFIFYSLLLFHANRKGTPSKLHFTGLIVQLTLY